MKNVPEQLSDYANDLALSVGGRHCVEVWAWVSLTPCEPIRVNCQCIVGSTGNEFARGAGTSIEAAMVKCIADWQSKGAVADFKDAELRKLSTKAHALGYKLTPIKQEVAAAILESKPTLEFSRDE